MEKPKTIKLIFFPGWAGTEVDAAEFFSYLPKWIKPTSIYSAPISPTFPEARDAESLAKSLAEKIVALVEDSNFLLCGYSMGGRLATLAANFLSSRANFQGLILLSGGIGIETEEARVERRKADERWQKLLLKDADAFWQKWYEQEIFQSLRDMSEEKKAAWNKARADQDPSLLAEDLVRFGLGTHPSLLPVLQRTSRMPLLYLTGERDLKYCTFADRVRETIPGATVKKIPGVGHILPLEAPAEVAKEILSWVNNARH